MRQIFLGAAAFWIVLNPSAQAAPLRPLSKPPTVEPVGVSAPAAAPFRGFRAPREVLPDFSNVRWWFFGGIDLGGTSYSSIDPSFEGSRSGFVGGFRGLVSYMPEDFVFEGGLGWQYISINGNNPDGTRDSIQSRVPYLDVSARYRISRHLQLGPEFEFWLGSDYGLNEDLRSGLSNNGKFLGAKLAYEWDGKRRYRLGGRWLTGLGVPSRTVNQFVAFFEMGFDLSGRGASLDRRPGPPPEQVSPAELERNTAPREAPPAATAPAEPLSFEEPSPSPSPEQGFAEPAPDVMSTPAPPPAATPTPEPSPFASSAPPSTSATPVPIVLGPDRKMVVSMGYNDLPFAFNEARLPKAHSERVKRMGRFLAKNKTAWKSVQVAGHTDSRGSAKRNMDLSLRRAETVRQLLIEGGLSPARVRAVGYGETRPVDPAENERAWARNRRVELEFRQVNRPEVIKRAFEL